VKNSRHGGLVATLLILELINFGTPADPIMSGRD